MSDVLARVLRCFVPALERAGSGLDEVLEAHGLSPQRVRYQPGHRVAWNTFAELLEDIGERVGGLAALEEIGATRFFGSWPTFAAVAARYVNPYSGFQLGGMLFGPKIFRGIRAELVELHDGVIETVTIPRDRRDSSEFFALCLGAMRHFPEFIGWQTTSAELSLSDHRGEYRIHYRRPSADLNEDRGGFIPPLPSDFASDFEEFCVLDGEIGVSRSMARPADDPVGVAGGPIARLVRGILREEKLGSEPSSSAVARRLGMSERSLSRRLANEGTSYRVARDEVRCERAIERLHRGDSIAEIAFDQGFADVPAFHRAFRRWTGRSPGSYRQSDRSPSFGRKSQDFGATGQSGTLTPHLS